MGLKRQEYDSIKDDIVFLTKSFFRIRILISLFNRPATVKELQEEIDLNYPSVLSNINKLESKGYVVKKQEKYHLKSSTRIKLVNILALNSNINFLEEYEDFFNEHDVKSFSQEAFEELPVFNNIKLIKADKINPFKATDTYRKSMTRLGHVNAICSYLHPECKRIISSVMEQETGLNLMVHKDVAKYITNCAMNYIQKNDIKNQYFDIKYLEYEPKIAMVISDEEMVISLHRIEGIIDKNTCLISNDQAAINWAYSLFKEFESESKQEYISMKQLILDKLENSDKDIKITTEDTIIEN